MTKRILTILVLVLSLSLFASAAEISSANDMLTLMNTPSMWADSYTLTTDIDLSDATNGLSQTPIGTAANPFTGNFNGGGHTISGIAIDGAALGITDNVGLFGYIQSSGTVSIENLTVSGSVSGTANRVGGIIGQVYTTNITIQNCTNLCTVSGGADFIGGIVGRLDSSSENAIISGCKNTGAIAGNSYAGGIAGFSSSTSGSITVEKCLNTGSVTTVGGASAGIVGYWRDQSAKSGDCSVRDCMNTGAMVAGASGYAAGIIAHGAGKDVAYTVTRCFNTGTITASKASYVRPIVGRPSASTASSGGISNCYYTSTDTYTTAATEGEIFVSDATVAANVSGLGENFVLVDGYTPELKIFHTHTYKYASIGAEQHNYACYCGDVALTEAHNFVDGVCDKCGALAFCEHENGEWREISVASCVDLAKYVWYCADCVAVIEDITKDGEGLDSDNHVTENYIWNFDGEKYYFTCTACAARVEQADAPTVYLSAKGNDKNDGRTAEEAVATLTEAVSRIANVGGTVMICGSFPLSDTELPAYTKPITFKGDNGYFCGGFKLSKTAVLSLGGKTVFDNILFDGNAAYVIECNWNDVTFGKVEVINNAYTYIVLGAYNITENDDAEKEATVTITEGATLTYNVAGKLSTKWFYSRIYLGDIFGADGILSANKTATINATNADIAVLYTMSTSSAYKNNPVLNSKTTVNLYGKTTVDKGRTGDYNVNYADSTASLTEQTINFFDNSSVSTNYYIRNAENTVLHVSSSEEGRTQPMNLGFTFYSYGTFATSAKPMNVDFSYGTHSFAPALTNPIVFSAVADAQKVVAEQKNDECVYTSKVTVAATPDANGTKLYSCTCGRTYTEEYAYSCEDAAHLYIANADGAFTCKVCDETFATVSGENVFAVSSAIVENGILTVTATVSGNFAAAQFNVAVPDGFAFAKANLPTVDGFVFASGEIDGAYVVTILSESAMAKTVDTEIVLEYTLSEGATNDDAFIEVTVPELYTDDGEKAVATTVCAVLAKSECLHEITKEIITLAPTCTNTGSKNIVCAECGAVVEANAVVEKDLSNHGDYDYVCSDGKVVCYGCKSAVDSIDSPVVVSAVSESLANRTVSVTVSLKATAPILASRFAIDAPDGFTLVSAESLIGIADEAATGFTLVLPDSTSLPYDVIVMNMSLEDATIDAAVLKLTFAVEESGTHKVSVSALETYNCEKESIDTFAISAEITAEEHTHEYEAKITAPTCTEDGFTTYTCACGDSFVADETDATGHIWDGGKVTSPATPDAAGIKIYTCTVCGETKETTFSCTEHVYVAKTDGTYYCANGCEVSAPDAPVVVSIAPIAANGEEVTVTVSVRATTPIVAHRFRVNAPEGFTLSSINSLLGEAAANATGWTLTGENNTAVPCDISLFNMSGTDDAIDCTVAEFTFTVTDTVENGTYVFVVDSLETYNYSEEAIDAVSVDAEVTYVTHIHDYKVVVTVPTCTEGGYTTYTCECGDTYVADEVAALGHTEEILPAVEPTYESTGLTEGKKCSVCGEILVAQEEIPALEKPVISGDINGDGTVTIADALLLIRVILNDETIENGDVNGDGKVGLADVIRTIKLISQ